MAEAPPAASKLPPIIWPFPLVSLSRPATPTNHARYHMTCAKPVRTRFVPLLTVLAVMAASVAPPQTSLAIVINMQYTDEGDPVPHDENPSWDPSGLILKIRTSKLPRPSGSGSCRETKNIRLTFIGMTISRAWAWRVKVVLNMFVEINPSYNWFADPTPGDDSEFSARHSDTFQTTFRTESIDLLSRHGSSGQLEVGFRGTGIASTGTLITLSASAKRLLVRPDLCRSIQQRL